MPSYTIHFNEHVHHEFIDAFEWYETQQDGLGKKFMQHFEQTLQRLSSNPEYYSKIHEDFRQVKVSNFPFTIVYQFYPRKGVIHVAALHHTKRNPRKRVRK